MKVAIGMISPDRNCARKLAWKRSSLRCANSASTSRWRPNTLTTAWPVNASSTCALSVPVLRHWLMN